MSSLTVFAFFPQLPDNIKHQILTLALPPPRLLFISSLNEPKNVVSSDGKLRPVVSDVDSLTHNDFPVPALLHACKMTRAFALTIYTLSLHRVFADKPVYIAWERDSVFFTSMFALQVYVVSDRRYAEKKMELRKEKQLPWWNVYSSGAVELRLYGTYHDLELNVRNMILKGDGMEWWAKNLLEEFRHLKKLVLLGRMRDAESTVRRDFLCWVLQSRNVTVNLVDEPEFEDQDSEMSDEGFESGGETLDDDTLSDDNDESLLDEDNTSAENIPSDEMADEDIIYDEVDEEDMFDEDMVDQLHL